MNTAIIFVGLPGSGKTTFYEKYLKRPGLIRLSQDDYKKAIGAPRYHRPFEPLMKLWLDTSRDYFMSQGYNVLADGNAYLHYIRKMWIEAARKYKYNIKCYWFKTPLRTCIRNDFNRSSDQFVGEEVIRGIYSRFEPPRKSEGFDEIIIVRKGIRSEVIS